MRIGRVRREVDGVELEKDQHREEGANQRPSSHHWRARHDDGYFLSSWGL
jgi:hypothetical protein